MFDPRGAERPPERVLVSARIDGPIALDGHTLNLSQSGVLFESVNQIPVTLMIKGRRHHGILVRSIKAPGARTTSYAIQLTDAPSDDPQAA